MILAYDPFVHCTYITGPEMQTTTLNRCVQAATATIIRALLQVPDVFRSHVSELCPELLKGPFNDAARQEVRLCISVGGTKTQCLSDSGLGIFITGASTH